MQRIENSILVLSAADVSPVPHESIMDFVAKSRKQRFMAGVAGSIYNAELIRGRFQYYLEDGLSCIGWSESTTISVTCLGLHITTHKLGSSQGFTYTPHEGDEVLLGDLDCQQSDKDEFLKRLRTLNPTHLGRNK